MRKFSVQNESEVSALLTRCTSHQFIKQQIFTNTHVFCVFYHWTVSDFYPNFRSMFTNNRHWTDGISIHKVLIKNIRTIGIMLLFRSAIDCHFWDRIICKGGNRTSGRAENLCKIISKFPSTNTVQEEVDPIVTMIQFVGYVEK